MTWKTRTDWKIRFLKSLETGAVECESCFSCSPSGIRRHRPVVAHEPDRPTSPSCLFSLPAKGIHYMGGPRRFDILGHLSCISEQNLHVTLLCRLWQSAITWLDSSTPSRQISEVVGLIERCWERQVSWVLAKNQGFKNRFSASR